MLIAMSNFQGIVLSLLAVIVARTFANGHDIREDWGSAERAVLVITSLCGWVAVGIFASNWIFA